MKWSKYTQLYSCEKPYFTLALNTPIHSLPFFFLILCQHHVVWVQSYCYQSLTNELVFCLLFLPACTQWLKAKVRDACISPLIVHKLMFRATLSRCPWSHETCLSTFETHRRMCTFNQLHIFLQQETNRIWCKGSPIKQDQCIYNKIFHVYVV